MKGVDSEVNDEKLDVAEKETRTENAKQGNERSVQNGSRLVGKEPNSPTDSEPEAQTALETNDTSKTQEKCSSETARMKPGENTTINDDCVQKSKNVNLHVKQDFSAINVGLEYTGDDVQPLEEIIKGDEGKETDGNTASEDDSDEEEEEEGEDEMRDDEQQDDIRAAYGKYE